MRPQTIRLDDKAALKPYLSHQYTTSREACFEATKAALSELGIEIKSEDATSGKIETKRLSFTAMGYQPGRSATTTTHTNSTTGTSTVTTKSGTPGMTVQQQQQYKYYIVVSGDQSQCTVEVVRFRAWVEGKEVYEVGLVYARDNVWKPFFVEIEESLDDSF